MRVKGGYTTRKRRKKILKTTKGYRGKRSKLYRKAKESYLHSGQYSFNDRRKRYGEFRRLWIVRLSAALQNKNVSYSQFINKLNKSDLNLNRKTLSELAINYPDVFDSVVDRVTVDSKEESTTVTDSKEKEKVKNKQ